MSIKILGTVDKLVTKDGRIVQQAGDTDGVVASFYDLSGRPSLFLDGTQARLGNVGVKTATPNQALTVVGNVSSDGYHYGLGVRGAGGGDLELKAGEFPWTLRWASGNLEVATSKGLIGGSYGGSQVMFPNGGGLQLNSLRDGGTYVQTGSAGDVNKTWAFTNDGSLTLPAGATLQSAGPDILIGSNLVPTTSAFYIGDPGNPVAGIYLAATTLYIASSFAGVSGLKLSNVNNVFTVADGGLRSSIIYTGGLLLSGNNIGADPLYSGLPMTIGTGGLPAVEFLVPIKLKTTTGTPNISGNASFSGSVSAVSLVLSDGLIAHNTTILGTLSATGLISQQKNHCVSSLSANQAMTSSDTKIEFHDKDDPNNWWNSANHTFQPTVAGYYNIMVMVNWIGVNQEVQVNNQLRKNGNTIALAQMPIPKSQTHSVFMQAITHMNGSSDYLDVSGFTGHNTNITGEANGVWTKFEAFKIS
jgi:hypothetical protein